MGTAVNYQGLDENQFAKTSQPDNIKNFKMPLSAGERAKKYREKKKLTDPEFLVKESERKKAEITMMKITNNPKNI